MSGCKPKMIDKDVHGHRNPSMELEAFKPYDCFIGIEESENQVQRFKEEDTKAHLHDTHLPDLLKRLQPAANYILSLCEPTLYTDSSFALPAAHTCYFGYAPVYEAEVKNVDLFPTNVQSNFNVVSATDTVNCSVYTPSIQTFDTLLSGAMAGVLSRSFTAPLDRLKVLRQVHGFQHAGSSAISAFRWMLREGGPRSLWRGNGTNVLKIAPETAVKFTMYDVYKDLLGLNKDSGSPLHEKLIAGSLAGATSQTLIYPIEVVKTRMCLRKTGQFSGGVASCLAAVYSEGGARVLYRGYAVTLAGILPYAGIELATYETVRARLHRGDLCPVAAAPLLAGALASSLGMAASYPLALLRTRLQAQARFSQPGTNTARGLAAAIYRTEGPVGFYRGMAANLARVLPSVAISFAVFDQFNQFFHVGHSLSGGA